MEKIKQKRLFTVSTYESGEKKVKIKLVQKKKKKPKNEQYLWQHPITKLWFVRYKGHRTKRGVKEKEDAIKLRPQFIVEVDAGKLDKTNARDMANEQTGVITLETLFDRYDKYQENIPILPKNPTALDTIKYEQLLEREAARDTVRYYTRETIEKYLVPILVERTGGTNIEDVTEWDIRQFERKYKQERRVADNTIDKHTSYIRNAFRCARKGKLEGGKFTRNNPLEDYEFEKHSNPRNVTLTREQKLRLLKECLNSRNRDLLTFVLIAINTGMRLREILGMRWAQVDLENRAIQLFISKTGQRIVRMNNTVLKYFQARERGADTDRVFSARNPRTAWTGARKRAGLKFLRLHDLRHVFATDLRKKTSTKNVQKALGHATETMTEIYINVADDELLETVCLLDDGVDELIQAVQNDTKIDTKPQNDETITESGS